MDPQIKELIKTAQEMRNHQRAYFRHRSTDVLELSKAAERRLDALLASITAGPGLFDAPPEQTIELGTIPTNISVRPDALIDREWVTTVANSCVGKLCVITSVGTGVLDLAPIVPMDPTAEAHRHVRT